MLPVSTQAAKYCSCRISIGSPAFHHFLYCSIPGRRGQERRSGKKSPRRGIVYKSYTKSSQFRHERIIPVTQKISINYENYKITKKIKTKQKKKKKNREKKIKNQKDGAMNMIKKNIEKTKLKDYKNSQYNKRQKK
jgi:hypothetical protein